jgi:hypothetical protein
MKRIFVWIIGRTKFGTTIYRCPANHAIGSDHKAVSRDCMKKKLRAVGVGFGYKIALPGLNFE